jgi:hypothetical protein
MLDLSQFDAKGLDLLFEVHENLCENFLKELRTDKDTDTDEYKEKSGKFGSLLYHLQQIADEINNRRKENLVYSIEDVYKFAGQFDKYTIFRFYKTSEAFKKYGDDAYGHLIYQKKERNKLEAIVSKEKYDRTDGKIFIDGASQNQDRNNLLKSEGFLVSDVLEVLTSNNFDNGKQYKKEGQKEIPNTIEVKFDPNGFDLEKSQVWLASNRIRDGYTLLNHEYIELYSNLFVLNPQAVNDENKEKYLLTADKSFFSEEAAIKILSAKYRRDLISGEEAIQFNTLLKQRRIARFEVVKKELGISNKQLEKFREAHPEKYKELYGVVLSFDTEPLSNYKTAFPIYWDFERFIHIYLRHYSNFFIEQSTARGTHFQYSYKDIRRVACLIIENLKEEIETDLPKGKGYSKYGDKGYYFNGNFYTIRIDKQGRLMQFHPLE